MTPEQADKIVLFLEHRAAPKPKPEQKLSLKNDLLQFSYEKTVDKAKQYALESSWFPVISQIAPSPELKPYKKNFRPGIKGKQGVQIIKKALERTEHGKAV